MANELDLAMATAIVQEVFEISCDSMNDANNLRQRFYRRREDLMHQEEHELFLLLEHFTFELKGPVLRISYSNPNQKILESLNDQQKTGSDNLGASRPTNVVRENSR